MNAKVRVAAINVMRLAVAATFVLSGFVKAVDPLGTKYKIEDYLEAMGLAGVVPQLVMLAASVALSAVEFWLGICLLFAIRRRLVSRLLVAVMCVMTPLTLWLAVAEPISDCGCFGDAVKLTNWQTFWKDVALLAMTVALARRPFDMVRFISRTNQWIVLNYSAVFIVVISAISLYDRPQFDFRPYHEGADIRQGMAIPPDAPQPQFETTFTMEKDGERREFTIDNYPDSTWTFVSSETKMVAEGYVPPIHDFSIVADNGEDITEAVLADSGYTFLLIAPYLEQADDSQLGLINQVYEYASDYGYPFLCLTASGDEARARWRDITGAEYPYATTDATTLQTVIRSNPGLVLLKDGKVVRKWSHNRLPDEYALNGPLEEIELGRTLDNSIPRTALAITVWFVLPLTLLSIADRLWAWTRYVRRVRKGKRKDKTKTAIKQDNNDEKEDCSRQLEDEHDPARRPGTGQRA